MKIFNSSAQLQGTKLQAGQYVGLYGTSAKGDAGAGIFYIEHTGYTPTGDDIVLANTNVARLVLRYFDAMNPEYQEPVPGSITNAMLEAVATGIIKGRLTAGTGEVQDLTAAQIRSILNVEDGATADMTGAQIKAAYEGEAVRDRKSTRLNSSH